MRSFASFVMSVIRNFFFYDCTHGFLGFFQTRHTFRGNKQFFSDISARAVVDGEKGE